MDSAALFGAIAVIFLVCVIVAYQMFKRRNGGEDVTIDDFTTIYGGAIIKALMSAVELLSVNKDEFETEEEYRQAVIYQTIEELKSNATDLGIDAAIVNLFSTEALTAVVTNILNGTLNLHLMDMIDVSDERKHKEITDAANKIIDDFSSFTSSKNTPIE